MPSFESSRPVSATIEVAIGDLHVDAGDRAVTTVEVRPSDPSNPLDRKAAEQARVEYGDGELLVKAKLRSWRPRRDEGSVDVTVALPAGSDVDVTLGLADARCTGRLGLCRVKAGIGRVEVEEAATLRLDVGAGDGAVGRVTGDAEATSGSGSLRLSELDRGATVKNANGDIWIGAAGGDVRVKAANGSIAIERASGDVDAKSANGDVRVGEVARGSVVLETRVGDVEVGIPEGVAAWLDLNARAGRVHNALDAAAAPDGASDTVQVRARTTLGDVAIRRPTALTS
jgi:hypothetical protein